MPEPIIQVEGLSSAYESRVILENISFDIFPGEVFGILGGSGVGKSTLLKHMIGLERPRTGRIRIDGREVFSRRGSADPEILRKIGVMFQSGALFGSRTLLENLALPMEELTALPKEARILIALMNLNLVGLAGFEHFLPSQLSGGMRKRGAIARALVLAPRIVFLDEPSADLDPITSADLDRTMLGLARSLALTFVIVTHDLATIFGILDRAILLDPRSKGIAAQGKPQEMFRRSGDLWVRQFFSRMPSVPKGDVA
jgi:phospholipid/cholesterol/gamma-HCH transport system ATP-binding protein